MIIYVYILAAIALFYMVAPGITQFVLGDG